MPERCALSRVVQRRVVRRLGDTDGPGGDVESTALERRQGLLHPAALDPTQQPISRHPDVVQHDLAGLGPLVPELADVLADGETWRVGVNEQDAHATVPWLRFRISLYQDRQRVRIPGIGDPHLRTSDHVVITVETCGRGDALELSLI